MIPCSPPSGFAGHSTVDFHAGFKRLTHARYGTSISQAVMLTR
jgi:hypothetical protein